MRYDTGQLITSYLSLLIPMLVTLLLWGSVWLRRESYRRRFQGKRLFWEMWGSTLLLTITLAVLFYWYLFWRPFYTVTVLPEGEWALHYVLPEREARFPAHTIESVALRPERLIPARNRGNRQFVVVQLIDGRVFTSAPLRLPEAQTLTAQLQSHRISR